MLTRSPSRLKGETNNTHGHLKPPKKLIFIFNTKSSCDHIVNA